MLMVIVCIMVRIETWLQYRAVHDIVFVPACQVVPYMYDLPACTFLQGLDFQGVPMAFAEPS